jgi:outer membrane protein insertion porin family
LALVLRFVLIAFLLVSLEISNRAMAQNGYSYIPNAPQPGSAYGTGNAYNAGPLPNPPGAYNVPANGPIAYPPVNGGAGLQPAPGPFNNSSGQPYAGQPYEGQPYAVQPNNGQPYASQPYASPPLIPGPMNEPGPRLNEPWLIQPNSPSLDTPFGYNPRVRDVPVNVYVQEGQTGRFSVGGSVNSDLGVAGQFILEERNFDIARFPSRPSDLLNGAFRGAGQNFRAELVPGNLVQRYTLNWTEPNLFGYSPFSLSVGGFYFTRIYRDWTEKRIGARVAIGYEIAPDLSLTTELRGEDVKISNPRSLGVPALDRVLGSNDLYTARVRLAHNTRDSPFLPTEGHLLEMIYDQNFGEFDFPRAQINYSRYFKVRERADGSGKHTFTSSMRLGFTGADTPLFENFFAGGFSTMRGFQFRGASPVESGIQVGGRFQMLGSFEYMMPVTADDMLRMVAFVDYGTIERDIEINAKNFRVAPGFGARIAVPALGPAPLAFDFTFPVAYADTDTRQIFSFTMGLTR